MTIAIPKDVPKKSFKLGPAAARLLKADNAPQIVNQRSYWKLVGSDPEIFAANADGACFPAFEFLPSKKQNPNYYWDGYQAEFTVPATACLDQQRVHLSTRLRTLRQIARERGKDLTLKNTYHIPVEQLQATDPKFVQFGCSKSFNAYDEGSPLECVFAQEVEVRTAGGHLHFSFSKPNRTNKEKMKKVVRYLDAVLGVISVSLFQYWDSPDRRKYYGRAGEFRLPPHGLEYRVLSNAWLSHPIAFNFVYELARRVIPFALRGPVLPWDASEEEIRDCINNCDVKLAHEIINRNKEFYHILLKSLPDSFGGNWKNLDKIIREGFHTRLENPDKVSEEWFGGYRGQQLRMSSQLFEVPGPIDSRAAMRI